MSSQRTQLIGNKHDLYYEKWLVGQDLYDNISKKNILDIFVDSNLQGALEPQKASRFKDIARSVYYSKFVRSCVLNGVSLSSKQVKYTAV